MQYDYADLLDRRPNNRQAHYCLRLHFDFRIKIIEYTTLAKFTATFYCSGFASPQPVHQQMPSFSTVTLREAHSDDTHQSLRCTEKIKTMYATLHWPHHQSTAYASSNQAAADGFQANSVMYQKVYSALLHTYIRITYAQSIPYVHFTTHFTATSGAVYKHFEWAISFRASRLRNEPH
jgi:hypothetical protein